MAQTVEQSLQADLARKQSEVTALKQQLKDANSRNDDAAKASIQSQLDIHEEILDTIKDRLKYETSIQKSIIAQLSSYQKLSKDVKNRIAGDSETATFYKESLVSLGKLQAKQKQLQETGEVDENLDARVDLYSNLTNEIQSQAKQNEALNSKLKGQTDFERERLDILNTYSGIQNDMTQSILDEARANGRNLSIAQLRSGFGGIELKQKVQLLDELETEKNKIEDLLKMKEAQVNYGLRLEEIERQQQDLISQMPEGIQNSIGFAKQLGGAIKGGFGPLFLIGSILALAIKSFVDLEQSAKEFRETTGLTNSQMEGIRSQANQITGEFAELGIESKDVFNTVAGLKAEFSDVAQFSDEVVAGLTVMSKNFGVSAENAAKVQGIFEQVGGLSSETATSLGLQVTQMANLAGVAPAKVMEDIAQSAEIASTLFRGDAVALAKNAIEARRLGTNLQSVASTAEKLLDFESGIGDELVAATFVGGQFNLNRARALAFEGKIVEAQKEVLAQVQRTGDFREKDYFTQQQLAKAAGMSVEEINKQLNAQEKLNSLSVEELKLAEDAISKGLDITNINKEDLANQVAAYSVQQEQQATLDKLQNSFMGIASTIGTILVPLLESIIPVVTLIAKPFQWMADGLSIITENFGVMVGFLSTMALYSGIVYTNKLKTFALTARQLYMERIQAGFSLKGAIASIWSSLAKIPFGVGLIGAAAATAGLVGLYNAVSVGDMYSPASGKTRVSTKEGGLFELSPNDDLVAAPGIASMMGSAGGGGNSAMLSAPLAALLNEIKGMRTDLGNGKVAVYMDTTKVTSTISRKVDQSTRNSFTMGSA